MESRYKQDRGTFLHSFLVRADRFLYPWTREKNKSSARHCWTLGESKMKGNSMRKE